MAGDQETGGNERESAGASQTGTQAHPQPLTFIGIIRGRNCRKYIGKCLRSLERQTYPHWKALVCLDEPTDGSEKLVIETECVKLVVNPKRLGLGRNMYHTIMEADRTFQPRPSDVGFVLDADDWLDKTALKHEEVIYRKHPKTLVTHGSYIKESKGRKTKISRPYPKSGNVRKLPWRGSHLKTFRWKLVKRIKPEWWRHKGKWLDAASDLGLMFGLIGIAGLNRVRHVSYALYHWRDNTSTKTGRSAQRRCEKILRAK